MSEEDVILEEGGFRGYRITLPADLMDALSEDDVVGLVSLRVRDAYSAYHKVKAEREGPGDGH